MSDMWVPNKTVRKWVLPRRPAGDGEVQEMVFGHFQKVYKKVKEAILQVECMDDLLSGACSHVVTGMHVHHIHILVLKYIHTN